MEETKIRELRLEATKRVIKYEIKTRQSKKKIIEYMEELEKKRERKKESKWENSKREVMEEMLLNEKEKEARGKEEDNVRNNRKVRKKRKREKKK